MDKYKIAEQYLKSINIRDAYLDKIPNDLRCVVHDNVYSEQVLVMEHFLLLELLGEQDLDDLYYFVYEKSPRIEYNGEVFTDIISYWKYCDKESRP
jgi:hypothetical protein